MLLGEKKRLDYIDWVKAVSILFIVIGHFLPSNCWPKVLLYSFHVPIFVIIGGVLFTAPKTWREYGKKCFGLVKRLLIPFIIVFVLCCLVYWLPEEMLPKYGIDDVTRDIVTLLEYAVCYRRKTVWNQALWFIPCYLVISLIMLIFTKLTKGNRLASLGLSALSFITLLELEKREITIDIGEVKDVFGMKNYFLMLGFFALGYALRPMLDMCLNMTENPRKNPLLYASGCSFVMLAVMCLKCNVSEKDAAGYNHISLYSGYYNDMKLFIFFGIMLSVTLIIALMLLPGCKLSNLLSRNSLFIMMTHMVFLLHNSFVTLTPVKTMWEVDMKVSIRDGFFVFMIFVVFLWILDALVLQRFPKVRKVLGFIGIQ